MSSCGKKTPLPMAEIKVRGGCKLTKAQRMKVAQWLRMKASEVVKEADQYAPVVQMRLW